MIFLVEKWGLAFSIMICILSRVLEVFFGGILLFIIWLPEKSYDPEYLYADLTASIYACVLFEFISRYILTSSYVNLYMNWLGPYKHGAVVMGLFILHSATFLIWFWPSGVGGAALLVVGGSLAVGLIGVAGRKIAARAVGKSGVKL